jgi:hypothetical protein
MLSCALSLASFLAVRAQASPARATQAQAPPASAAQAQSPATTPADENPYAATFAAEGTGTDTFVYMHNRRGLRIEVNLDKKTLDLWISPRAGTSADYRDRNFSNRDDHTSVFDRIGFPALDRKDFVGCDYDAFHSVLRFREQALHVALQWDRPVVLVWFDRPGIVDLKTDKQDRPGERTERVFAVDHPDRGRAFRFVAALRPGGGRFLHQRDVDEGRSTYARVELPAGETLAIGGELAAEPVASWVKEAAGAERAGLLAATEARVREALSRGRIRLRGRPELQKVLDTNLRAVLSMQDESGAIRAAIRYIYYLIWVRDGALVTAPMAQAGFVDPLTRWNAFLLANPTVTEHDPKGRFFGQLVNGRISKWEEDGLFWAVWSAFTHVTQTGDRRFARGESLAALRDGMNWLERLTWDGRRGLFGRYYAGETPLSGSRGDGWDDAVGSPAGPLRTEHEGRVITRSYDVAANLTGWSSYVMLAALDAEGAAGWLAKARALEERLRPWLERGGALPDYGELQTQDGALLHAGPYGMDAGDYTWALSVTPFAGEVFGLAPVRERILDESKAQLGGTFLATHFSLLASLDPEMCGEAKLLAAIDRMVPYAVRPGRYLPMAYSAPEVAGVEDGHPYHDVRPQAFSFGPWMWAVASLGVRRLPFGLTVRATSALEGIDAYEYGQALVDVSFEGHGGLSRVTLNGRPLEHTLQVPERRLVAGPNRLVVEMKDPGGVASPLLVSSTVRLGDVSGRGARATYDIEAFGKNVLVFRGTPAVAVRDAGGRPVPAKARTIGGHAYVEFEGRGRFRAAATASR